MNIDDVLSFQHESDKKGSPAYSVQFGCLKVFISYRTVVGFNYPGMGKFCRANVWGRTTGGHYTEMGLNEATVLEEDELNLKFLQAVSEESVRVKGMADRDIKELQEKVDERKRKDAKCAADRVLAKDDSKRLDKLRMVNHMMDRARLLGKVLHTDIAAMVIEGKKPETIWKKLLADYPTIAYSTVKEIVTFIAKGNGDVHHIKGLKH